MYAEILENIIDKDYPLMCALKLKKNWDEHDGSLYLPDERRFTPLGFKTYWLGVNSAFKFWEKTLADILVKNYKKSLNPTDKRHNETKTTFQNPYYWQKPRSEIDQARHEERRHRRTTKYED